MRPIDADNLLQVHKMETNLIGKDWTIDDLVTAIELAPTIDVIPIKHGYWTEKRWITDCDWGCINHRAMVCSVCNVIINDGEKVPYCPYCGAKMDKENN